MRRLMVTLAMLTSTICMAWEPHDDQTESDKRECGPSLPGNADGWADSHEGNAWAIRIKNARGPTGHCEDPNPRPDKDPKGILMAIDSNGPTGPDWTYWVSLTEDHYAGPDHGLD